MKIVINYMSRFFRGKLKIVLKDVAKQSAQQKTKKSGKKKQQPGSKKQSPKNKCVTKYKKKQKEPKKKKGKSVNSLPASEFDNEPDTSTEKVIPNNSIDLSNKESLSEEERNVNGVKESNDSRLSNEAVTGTQGIKEVQEHVPKHKKKKTSVTIVDLGLNSDCSEQDSQVWEHKSEDESQPKMQVKLASVDGENIVEPESSLHKDTKEKQDAEAEWSFQQNQEGIQEKLDVEISVQKENEEKQDAERDSTIEQITEDNENLDIRRESSVQQEIQQHAEGRSSSELMEEEIKEKLDVQVESEDSEDSIQQGIQQKRDAEPELPLQEEINKKLDVKHDDSLKEKIEMERDVQLVSPESEVQKEIEEKSVESNSVTNEIHLELTVFTPKASEITKEAKISRSDSDSETRGLKEKLVDYTSSDETSEKCEITVVTDRPNVKDTSENCQINVVTDRPNVKDPLISGGTLQEDAQESSDAEERDKIQRKSDELFSSDEENRSSYPIVQEILEKWEAHEQKQKDELVLRSPEAYRLENKDELLTDEIHKNVVIVSATGEEVNSGQVESTSDTTISTANTASDSDSGPELIITRKKKRKK
ncbi:MAG: hypothetical protein MPL62_01360 [Alphaproteobacteria bacterium]|nr:hypothetical protein [Alphaproteobacteria bacterium]